MIPPSVRPFLWSYDLSKLDLVRDKKRIVTNVLNLGTKEATDWLFATFNNKDLCDAVENPLPGEWNKKSIHFWAVVLGVKSGNLERHIF